jgi:hypothetical protein
MLSWPSGRRYAHPFSDNKYGILSNPGACLLGYMWIQVGRHAVVNLRAIEEINHYGDRLYRLRLRDRNPNHGLADRCGPAG